MIPYGFSVRHWQMIEAGRPITAFTLLCAFEAFDISPEKLVTGQEVTPAGLRRQCSRLA
jgi:hypothetical protein